MSLKWNGFWFLQLPLNRLNGSQLAPDFEDSHLKQFALFWRSICDKRKKKTPLTQLQMQRPNVLRLSNNDGRCFRTNIGVLGADAYEVGFVVENQVETAVPSCTNKPATRVNINGVISKPE
jgi:hypothetical protein